VQDEALREEQMEQGGGEDAVGQEEGDEGEGSDERDGEESSENKEDGEQEGGEDEDGAEVAGEEDGEQEESDDEESDDEYPAMTSMNDLTMDLTSLLLACNRGSLAGACVHSILCMFMCVVAVHSGSSQLCPRPAPPCSRAYQLSHDQKRLVHG